MKNAGDISSYIENIQYMDGLGRLAQEVQCGITPTGKDLVTVYGYDTFGRKSISWLPVSVANNGEWFPLSRLIGTSYNFYNNSSGYTTYRYEASPLNRLTAEQGPGEEWDGKAQITGYSLNTQAEACPHYLSSSGIVEYWRDYLDGELFVTSVTDENGNVSRTFKDPQGKIIMERLVYNGENHDTRYVYDDFNNLRYVLPPMISEGIEPGELEKYAFCYEYNERNLCTEYTAPGCEAVLTVYDSADRPVLTQGGELRKAGKWKFTLYDVLGRATVEGIGEVANTAAIPANRVTTTFSAAAGFKETGYSVNGISISESTAKLLTVNYYDGYSFLSLFGMNPGLTYQEETGYATKYGGSLSGKGQLTGTRSFFTGSEQGEIITAMYYDDKGRIVQQRTTNQLNGVETDCYLYTFTGKPLKHLHRHTAAGKETQTEIYTYTYDHSERVIQVKHQLNDLPEVILASNTYDELGRLSEKKLHGDSYNATYAYNIRSWLTGINGSKFSQTLKYTDGPGTPCYNGNVSSMTWNGSDGVIWGYKYSYDELNRMVDAAYGEGATIGNNSGRFSEKVTSYDKNGNIKGLLRYGQTSAGGYGIVDNLNISLEGNLLKAVDDAAGNAAYNSGFEFKNGASQAAEYEYDANGNLKTDLNKNILDIQYNYLNLPLLITFGDGSTVSYLYSADGAKLRTVHTIAGTTTVTDYCGNVLYEDGIAKLLLTEEGYVSLSDNKYHYYLQDHQGNNRAVIDQNGNIEETNQYYPFGGVFESAGNVQPYKYNGKELDTKKGLNWYDYGARQYDAVLGRFTTVDPMAEKYYSSSTYAYCGNDPVSRIDPDGKDWRVQTRYNQERDKIEYMITVNAVIINNSSNKNINMQQLATYITQQVNTAYTITQNDFVSNMNFNLKVVNSMKDAKETDHLIEVVDQKVLKNEKPGLITMAQTQKLGSKIQVGMNAVNNMLNGNDNRTIAHEIGHTGGLTDNPTGSNGEIDGRNLMTQKARIQEKKGDYFNATRLTHSQIQIIQQNYIHKNLKYQNLKQK